MNQYTEIEVPEDDADKRLLTSLSHGMPYAFVVATELEPLSVRVASNQSPDAAHALLNQTLRGFPDGAERISDGFHTFAELYDHRRALTAALCQLFGAWRSKAHHPLDSAIYPGYFIVGIDLPTGTITYHYDLKRWDDFSGVPEFVHAPRWDGAGPADTVSRLLTFAKGEA